MEPPKVEKGSRVTVHTTSHNGNPATVRFIGQVAGKSGVWLGLQLDTPQGSNNGSVGGASYFECPDNHGLFVRAAQVRLLEPEKKSLIKGIRTKKPDSALEESKEEPREAPRNVQDRREELDLKRQEKIKIREGMGELRTRDKSVDKGIIEKRDQEIQELKDRLTEKDILLDKRTKENQAAIVQLQERIKALQAQEVDDASKELIETLTLEKENLEESAENLRREIEELNERIQILEEDLELKTLEIEELHLQATGDVSDLDKTELQSAVRKLYNDNQTMRIRYEERIYELENSLGSMPELERKLNQIPELRQQIQAKEAEILELKEALEQTASFSDMIEQLTEQNLKLQKKLGSVAERRDELQQLLDLEEQFAEDQAEIEKALNDEIANQQYQISQLKNQLASRDEQRAEQERTFNQYRIRFCDMQNDMQSLREQLADSGEQEKLSKINDLISKNLGLGNKIRLMISSDINGKLSEVENRLLERKMQYLSEAIPPQLLDQLDFQSFNNLNALTASKTKSYLLARELLIHTIDVPCDKSLIRWVNNVISMCTQNFANFAVLEDHIFNASFGEYQDLIKKIDWGQVSVVNSAIDQYLAKLKEGGLSPNISLDSFKLSSQEINAFRETEVPLDSPSAELIRNLVLSALGIYSLYHLYDFDTSIFAGIDFKELYQKALTISYKLQFINTEEDSQAIRNFSELLLSRYNAVAAILYSEDQLDFQSYNWTAWCEHMERDLKNITLLPTYKKPTGKSINPPWISLAHEVKNKLAKFEETVKELEECQANLKIYSVNLGKSEKELSDARIAKQNLESRLRDANAKSQRLNQMEVEKKRLQDREKYFEESLEALNVEMEKLQQNNKLLQEELSHCLTDAENQVFRKGTSANLETSSTPAGSNSLTILRPTPPVGQDELEAFRAIIDLYQHERREGVCAYVRSQVRRLPRFEGMAEGKSKELAKMAECKKQMLSEVGRMKLVDLRKDGHVEEFRRQKENLDSIRATARSVFSGIPKSYNSSRNVPLGTISSGEGETTLEAELSLFELKQIQRLIRI